MRCLSKDQLITAGLFTATLLTRIPFRSHTLNTWDSVGFALGLERFDIARQQPVPPGYLLYEAAGRFSHLVFSDANTALVAVSILGSAATITGVFLLGKAMFDRATGLLAAMLLLFSPLTWFYGEVALTYAFAAPFALAATWLLYQLYFERRGAIATAALIGLIGGIRLDLLFFLAPLLIIGTLRLGRRQMLLAWVALAVTVMAWLAPLIDVSGGIAPYLDTSRVQADIAIRPYTVFAHGFTALGNNLRGVWQALVWLFGVAGILLAFIFVQPFLRGRGKPDRRVLMLMALPAPALAYFLLFQIGQPGYLLVWAGPLSLLLARLIVRSAADLGQPVASGEPVTSAESADSTPEISQISLAKPGRIFLVFIAVIAACANSLLFLEGDNMQWQLPFTEAPLQKVLGPYTASGIKHDDRAIDAAVASVRQFKPGSTVVAVGVLSDWRKLMYYLPEYRVIMLRMDTGEGHSDGFGHQYTVDESKTVELPQSTDRLVFINLDTGPLPGLTLLPVPADVQVFSEAFTSDSMQVGPYTIRH